MNKIATLLIISIALIAMGTVSAFSDADHIVEAPFTVANMDGQFLRSSQFLCIFHLTLLL